MKSGLIDWLNERLNEKGWSQRQLARRAGISSATISEVMSDKRRPTWEFCHAIASALGVPPGVVFREAGLMTSPALDDATARQVLDTLEVLSIEGQLDVLAYAEHRYRRESDK